MQDFFSQLIHIAQIQWVQQAFWTVVLALATLATSRIVARAMRHILDRDNNPLPSSSIIINIVRATILILGASIILDVIYNINANAIITTLGVGGIAISLGFQDTLSNLIGGLQVTFMGIVRPGDNIEVGSETGVVQDVSWRHTTIKDALGQTVIVPNSIISKTALVHLLPASRVVVPFAVPRQREEQDAEPFDIDALAEELAAMAKAAAGDVSHVVEGPKVVFSEITEFGIKGKVIFVVEDPAKTSAAADAVVRAIARSSGRSEEDFADEAGTYLRMVGRLSNSLSFALLMTCLGLCIVLVCLLLHVF